MSCETHSSGYLFKTAVCSDLENTHTRLCTCILFGASGNVPSSQLQTQCCTLHVTHMVMCMLHRRWIRIVNLPMQCMNEKNVIMLQIRRYIMTMASNTLLMCVELYSA